MSQIILVGSYLGCSDYTFQVSVTGRLLAESEVRQLGFLDDDSARRHKDSAYSREWYEIAPGDRITVEVGEDDVEEMVFEIPDMPLPVLPQKLDDVWSCPLLKCLKEHCVRVQ